MSPGEGFFPVLQQLLSCIVGVVLARENRHTIPHLSSKHGQGGGELGDRVNCVPVGEDCFMKGVDIQGAGGAAALEKVGRSDKARRTTNGSSQFRQSSSDNQWE